jgi:hypothetical protein
MIETRNCNDPLSLQMCLLLNSTREYVLPIASEYLSLEIASTVFKSLIQESNISPTFAQENVVAPTSKTIAHLAHMQLLLYSTVLRILTYTLLHITKLRHCERHMSVFSFPLASKTLNQR